jgi:hypothetical protein
MVALASGAMGLDGSLRIVGAPGGRNGGDGDLGPARAAMARGSGFRLAPQIIPKGWNTLKMPCVVGCSTSQGWVPCCQTRSDLGPEKTTKSLWIS